MPDLKLQKNIDHWMSNRHMKWMEDIDNEISYYYNYIDIDNRFQSFFMQN